MKLKYCIVLLLITLKIYSQNSNDLVIYYDSLDNKCSADKYDYKQVIVDYNIDQSKYKVLEYDYNNLLLSEGFYKDKNLFIKDGWFAYYFQNGQKEYIQKYENNFLTGSTTYWYENGNKRFEGLFLIDSSNFYKESKIKLLQFWDTSGKQTVVNGYGYLKDVSNDESFEFGKILNGFKDSTINGFIKSLNINYTEEYKLGKFISGISIDSNNNSYSYNEKQIITEPIKGYENFYKKIKDKLSYKKSELKNNIDRDLIVRITITREGSIDNIRILKSLNINIDQQIIKLLKESTIKWVVEEYKGIKMNKDIILGFNL